MRPLHVKDIPSFLKRFANFVDGEFRNIDIISPTSINITFSAQDANRGFDWVTVKFECIEITEASLLSNSNLSYVDMSDGVNIESIQNTFTINIQDSTFLISSKSLKYEEGLF